jgi:hypothetical protein
LLAGIVEIVGVVAEVLAIGPPGIMEDIGVAWLPGVESTAPAEVGVVTGYKPVPFTEDPPAPPVGVIAVVGIEPVPVSEDTLALPDGVDEALDVLEELGGVEHVDVSFLSRVTSSLTDPSSPSM